MGLLKILIKELAETMLRTVRIISSNVLNSGKFVNVKQLAESGMIVLPGFYPKDKCNRLIAKIDSYLLNENVNVWVDEEGSDHRIFFVNEMDEEFNEFYEHPVIRGFLSSYTGNTNPKGLLLASRVDFVKGNRGSGGGWHRDSPISHQFKAICYLSDVSEENGCFQYIKGSHSKRKVIFSYVKRIFRIGQFRFADEDIDKYLKINNSNITSVDGSAGDLVLVDTKGIHRGKPLEKGTRYVLFCYFWENKIPPYFLSLKQAK
jgi:hypothetical protein